MEMEDNVWKSIEVFTFENEIKSLDHTGTFDDSTQALHSNISEYFLSII